MADIPEDDPNFDTIDFAVQLTTAWLSNPNTRASETDVLAFLKDMHGAVDQLSRAEPDVKSADVANEYTPAVSVRKSLASKDHIISMIDGKPYKTLRRHLAGHGLTRRSAWAASRV
ncbi:MucR family transcriptional regulator [Sphingomonas sp.]|uniref:MucR family transcriptional regulator n=1 Tax=Sphingomonas sp. TaxID=28214 RepID=UPI00344BB47E